MTAETIFSEACAAAFIVTGEYLEKYGDRGDCGFAWVDIPLSDTILLPWVKEQIAAMCVGTKPMTREGKLALQTAEVLYGAPTSKDVWRFWMPGRNSQAQSRIIHEVGARAFSNILRDHGIDAYMGSCSD